MNYYIITTCESCNEVRECMQAAGDANAAQLCAECAHGLQLELARSARDRAYRNWEVKERALKAALSEEYGKAARDKRYALGWTHPDHIQDILREWHSAQDHYFSAQRIYLELRDSEASRG